MRNLDAAWRTLIDHTETETARRLAESEVREAAYVGMIPTHLATRGVDPEFVLEICRQVREEHDFEIGPQPVRFTERELRWVLECVERQEFYEPRIMVSVTAKLRHKLKTMRNTRNKEDRYALPERKAATLHARSASRNRKAMGQEVRRQDCTKQEEEERWPQAATP